MRSKPLLALALACGLAGAAGEPYRLALHGYHYRFPQDHFNHPAFQTEWWYYTGNVHTPEGRRFGFELTFFRRAVDREPQPAGPWEVRDVWMAHLALSDLDGGRFYHTERMNRAGAGLAGADAGQAKVWNGNWQARWNASGQSLEAVAEGFGFEISLVPAKPPVINGVDGVSQKAAGPGKASHYISLTRLAARGALWIGGTRYAVEGLAWMDHEFFTHELSGGQTGWDWFSMQFDDASELMLFRLRHKDGTSDRYSAGTYTDARGRSRHLAAGEFTIVPGRTWTSPDTGGRYPIEWRIGVPSLGIEVSLGTRLPRQEFTGKLPYWEGAIEIGGTRQGVGYLEMTGYAGDVRM
jgi:predicted secreted hydrolase